MTQDEAPASPKDAALKLALEYIETNAHERRHVRWAIKAALAQPEQEQEQERWQWIFEEKCGDRYTHKNLFYTEAEAAESAKICGVKAIRKTGESKVTAATPVAQPEQEPVGQVGEDKQGLVGDIYDDRKVKIGDKLYTSLPQRQWVGLTDEEVEKLDCVQALWQDEGECEIHGVKEFYRNINNKLKEKNNGFA